MCSKYALEQVDANRETWESRHASEDDFVKNMAFSEKEIEAFKAYVVDQGVELDEEEWSRSLPAIEMRLKAFFGRNVYNRKTFYRVIGGLNESLDRLLQPAGARIGAVVAHREAVRRALTYLAQPQHGGRGLKCLYRTVDEMWYAAGDRATDFNFYTKRLTLAGVYSATLLFWLDDASEDSEATWEGTPTPIVSP